jgi:signal transduction histidine kinase
VVQHAAAKQVTITLTLEGQALCLLIQDDGRGFDPGVAAEAAVSQQQLGILGMAERAELIGATFGVTSAPGEGTCVRVCLTLPVTGAPAGAETALPSEGDYRQHRQEPGTRENGQQTVATGEGS